MAFAVWSLNFASGSVCVDGMMSMAGAQLVFRSGHVTSGLRLDTSTHVCEPTTSWPPAPRRPFAPAMAATAYVCARVQLPAGGGMVMVLFANVGTTVTGIGSA